MPPGGLDVPLSPLLVPTKVTVPHLCRVLQVFSRLEVTLPVTNHEKKRHICSQLLKRCATEAQPSTPSALEQLALSCLPHPLQASCVAAGARVLQCRAQALGAAS